ncbi:MAG: hypoxanthine phosphoribosyltransferase, partial [Vulcanimicrobiota bacterium]
TEDDIKKRINQLAEQLVEDYRGEELCIISILRGAAVFVADLTRRLDGLNFHLDFLVLSRGPLGKAGEVKIIKDLDYSIYQKNVLIIEDMIDMGESVYYVNQVLKLREPKSIKICTLFDKPYHRTLPINIDYVGFVLPDSFVVGYGLDYHQKYRNLPFVGTLNPKLLPTR